MRPVIEIRVSLQGRTLQSLTFGGKRVVVGRSPTVNVSIDNPGVSWEHLRFRRHDDGRYSVRDLESANGTFLNGKRVTSAEIHDGDVLRLGKFSVYVTLRAARSGEEVSDDVEQTYRVILPAEHTTSLSGRDLRQLLSRATGRFRAIDPNETSISSESETRTNFAEPDFPRSSAPRTPNASSYSRTVYQREMEPTWVMVGWALIIGLLLGVLLTRIAFG